MQLSFTENKLSIIEVEFSFTKKTSVIETEIFKEQIIANSHHIVFHRDRIIKRLKMFVYKKRIVHHRDRNTERTNRLSLRQNYKENKLSLTENRSPAGYREGTLVCWVHYLLIQSGFSHVFGVYSEPTEIAWR